MAHTFHESGPPSDRVVPSADLDIFEPDMRRWVERICQATGEPPIVLTPALLGELYSNDLPRLQAIATAKTRFLHRKIDAQDLIHGAIDRVLYRIRMSELGRSARRGSDKTPLPPLLTTASDRGYFYVGRTIMNMVRDTTRKKSYFHEQLSNLEVEASTVPAPVEDALTHMHMVQLVRHLDAIGVPRKFLEPYIMAHAFGMEYQEIADRLGEKVNTVGTRIFRAGQLIRKARAAGQLDILI